MSCKLLVLLSLMAMASASPTPNLILPKPTIDLGGILNIGSSDLGVSLRSLLKTIIGSKYVARKSLTTILALRIKDWNSFCDFSIRVVVSLCDTIEAAYKGLGILISRIFVCLLRIIIDCAHGNGGHNPICSDYVHTLVGVSARGVLDTQALIKAYNLGDVRAQLNVIINFYTKGLGISRCKGSTRVLFLIAIDFVDTIEIIISGSGTLTKDHLTLCFKQITRLIGAIGNSRSHGLGTSIVKNYISACNKYLRIAGYKEIDELDDLATEINSCNDDNGPWDVSDEDDDKSTSVSVSVSIGKLLKGLLGVTRLAANIIKEIIGLVIRSAEDCYILLIKIAYGLGGVLDAACSGLGSLFVRVIGGLLKILLCFPGSSKYGICKPGWDRQFLVYDDVTSIELAIHAYGFGKIRLQVDAYINAYIKIRGQPTRSVKAFFDVCITLGDICDSKKYDITILNIIWKHVITLLGAVGNSNSKGVGTAVCNKLVPTLNKYLASEGIKVEVDTVIVNSCNDDDYSWTSDIDTSDGKTGWIIHGDTDVSGGNSNKKGLIRSAIDRIISIFRLSKRGAGRRNAVIDINIKSLKDVFNFILQLTLVLQEVLNNFVYGLGNLFVRIVAFIIKIAVCVKGYPGDNGICTKDWNENYGGEGDGSTFDELVVVFKLTRVLEEYNGYVNQYTGGKDISSTKGSIRSVLKIIRILIEIILNAEKISKDTVTNVFIHVTTITACIGNSKERDSGTEFIREVYPECGKYFKDSSYIDITTSTTVAETECANSNDDGCDWDRGDNSTHGPGGDNTTPSEGNNGTEPGGITGTTPTPITTTVSWSSPPSPGGDNMFCGCYNTTLSGGNTITPSPGGGTNTTPSGGNTTTPSPGGGTNTTPSGGNTTTPSPGGGTNTTPSGGNTTTPSPGGGTNTTPSGGNTTTPTPGGGTTPYEGHDTDDCGIIIGGAIKDIPGSIRLSTSILIKQIIEIKIRGIIDIVNLIVKLAIALGGILDLIVTGLGSIFVRIVAVIFKIGCCVHGWGDKSICTNEWNSQIGVYGHANTEKDIKDLFRVTDLTVITTLIGKYSGGKDISKENDFLSVILYRCTLIVEIISSKTITKQHWSDSVVHVLTIFGCISNSYSKGSGTVIIQKVITIIGPYLVQQGCPDIREEKTRVVTIISVGDNAQIDWKDIHTKSDAGDLSTDVKQAFKKVKGWNDKAAYNAVFYLVIPRSFDGCLIFIIKVVRALGAILDFYIRGLGSLLVRIIGCLINYIIAILFRSRHANSFVCRKAYYDSFGVTVTGTTWDDLVAGFNIGNCRSELDVIKAAHIKIKGTLNVVENLFFECGYSLTIIVSKGIKIDGGDLSELIRILMRLLCGFANSCSPNLGRKICGRFIPVCSSYLVEQKYPAITNASEDIYKSIDVCNNVPVSWVTETTVVVHHS